MTVAEFIRESRLHVANDPYGERTRVTETIDSFELQEYPELGYSVLVGKVGERYVVDTVLPWGVTCIMMETQL